MNIAQLERKEGAKSFLPKNDTGKYPVEGSCPLCNWRWCLKGSYVKEAGDGCPTIKQKSEAFGNVRFDLQEFHNSFGVCEHDLSLV